jgi:Ras-related protein Rab-18
VGAIVVYDVTDMESFEQLNWWMNDMETYSSVPDMVKILEANKIDKRNHEITKSEGLKFARMH